MVQKKGGQSKSRVKAVTPAMNTKLTYGFLFFVMAILGVAVLWMFRPFLINIILAGVLASFFYPLYEVLTKKLKSQALSAFLTTILIALLVFIPFVNFSIYLVNRSIDAYAQMKPYIQDEVFLADVTTRFIEALTILKVDPEQLYETIGTFGERFNGFLLSASSAIVKGTTGFLFNALVIFLSIYYLLVDGKKLAIRLMNLTPLPNKYDAELFSTFREVSYSTIVSTFSVAIFQGLLGGIGFMIVGLPGFFAGVMIGFVSILPYIGAFIIWAPVALYLLVTGALWQAIVLIIIGVIISMGDNILRAYLIKGRVHIHELLVFFSLIGGIMVFGFWGIVIGPLILSLLFTIINIYEKEFAQQLERAAE